jgi:hypothetical protein
VERITFSGVRSAAEGLREQLHREREYQSQKSEADRAYRRSQVPEPALLVPLCYRHNYNPEPRLPGGPRSDASTCPGCQEEARLEGRTPEEWHSINDPQVVGVDPPSQSKVTDAMDAAWAGEQRKRERAGQVIPGSLEEERILDAMDEQRAEEMDRFNPRRREPAFVSFDGSVVIYRNRELWRRRGRSGHYDRDSYMVGG